MSRDGDDEDEALRWEGDDDATLAPGWRAVGTPVPVARPADETTDAAASATAAERADQPGSAELVLLGVFGGVYLLYTLGWLFTVIGFGAPGGDDDPVAAFMFDVGLWLTVAAPALWYAVAFIATRGRPRARLLWMLAGAIVLVPLPFVLGVGL
ncbi:hypothetical protein [Agromyces sp. ZXT2-6]|uniref:hypothetical protein n=1 Tax=Agromyces sp. ZXT2-6 TaxID=3461153 RepID=UPI004054DAE7